MSEGGVDGGAEGGVSGLWGDGGAGVPCFGEVQEAGVFEPFNVGVFLEGIEGGIPSAVWDTFFEDLENFDGEFAAGNVEFGLWHGVASLSLGLRESCEEAVWQFGWIVGT